MVCTIGCWGFAWGSEGVAAGAEGPPASVLACPEKAPRPTFTEPPSENVLF